MAAMDRVWAIKSWTFNGATYDDDNGGPLSWTYEDVNNEISDRVADQIYPGMVLIPEGSLSVVITQRDPYTGITRGTKSNLVLTLVKNDGTTNVVLTFASMVYIGENASGQKSIPGTSAVSFQYEGSGTSRLART